MSTYSTIAGTVTLAAPAAAAFRASTSWRWFENPASAADASAADEAYSRTGPKAFVDSDGVTRIVFDDSPVRNLCRYLGSDLYDAQRLGAVWGTITDDCNDGCNVRTVARFTGDECIVGTAECFTETVAATAAHLLVVVPATGVEPGIRALVESGTGPVVVLEGARAASECCCTWVDDEPSCPAAR